VSQIRTNWCQIPGHILDRETGTCRSCKASGKIQFSCDACGRPIPDGDRICKCPGMQRRLSGDRDPDPTTKAIWSFLEDCAKHKEQKLTNLVAAFIEETGIPPSELVLVEDRTDRLKTAYYFAPKKDFEIGEGESGLITKDQAMDLLNTPSPMSPAAKMQLVSDLLNPPMEEDIRREIERPLGALQIPVHACSAIPIEKWELLPAGERCPYCGKTP
jgi:hypothetical protein